MISGIREKRIAIIGGGPGGLTLARLLQLRGASVTVYERDASRAARVQGATLNLNEESGLLAIRRCGLIDEFRAAFRPGAEAMVITDRHCTVLVDGAGGEHLEEQRPEIDRGPLRELLLDSLQEGTVVWDRRFVSLARDRGAVELRFEGADPATADLVIAADGASSRVRSHVTPITPVYAGITAIEGVVHDLEAKLPSLHRALAGGKICALGDERTLFVVLKGDGSAAFYSGHRAPERWWQESGIDFTRRDDVVAWFRREFAGWDAFTGLLEHADLFIPRPLYCAPLDQSWEAQSDITLLGDAAHVMPPYAGEGVNVAMLDAVDLADGLFDDRFFDIRDAIADYESRMRKRASETAALTMEFTNVFHSPDAIPYFVKFFSEMIPPTS